ncbi:MAG: DEAD/DEAH box helicase [Actinomycetes bacterium]
MPLSFADLGVPSEVVERLADRGIRSPFPIQELTLRDGLAGRDVSGRAPTGSGKTLAFGIPLVVDCPPAAPTRPSRLVLVPTRELATQVCVELRQLTAPGGPRVEAVFGGVSIGRQAQALRRGAEIVVACPGRLADMINQQMVRLDRVDMVVLDEADRMADMGFLPEVRRLLDQCPDDRRTILFSATLDGDVDVLVQRYQHDPVRHELVVDEDDLPEVDHYFWHVDRTDRVATTAQVVDRVGATVVFVRTKHGADRIARQLTRAGVVAEAIHGDRSQGQRDRALEAFRNGAADALVATDVAARGIHVDAVAAVVHFDPPADYKDYVHRSGRTGRAGARGVVVTMVHDDVRDAVKQLQRKLDLPLGLSDPDLSVLPRRDDTRPSPPSNRASRAAARSEARTDGRPDVQRDDRTEARTDDGPARRRRPSGGGARKGQKNGRPAPARKKAPRASKAARGDGPRSRTAGGQGR